MSLPSVEATLNVTNQILSAVLRSQLLLIEAQLLEPDAVEEDRCARHWEEATDLKRISEVLASAVRSHSDMLTGDARRRGQQNGHT